MPVLNRIAAFADVMTAWRRHLHAHPELGLDCHGTAAFVAARLREIGVDEVHEGIATSGVVALIHGRGPGRTVALRADMDALPITEATGAAHASTVPGRMHACGHDGHTAMLLGAARYLAETRAFDGTVALIFQPAEEVTGGARIMVEEGVIARFGIAEAYALHSAPGTPVGAFYTTPGPIMAAVDSWWIEVEGTGGHAAMPHLTADPILAACAIVQSLQSVSSRDRDPLTPVVMAATQVHAGTADNITPGTARLNGTLRTFDQATREMALRRLREIADGIAAAHRCRATVSIEEGYPPTINDPVRTARAVAAAREVGPVVDDARPQMGSEDFAYLLEKVPGAYLFVGNGDSAGLHHPAYDFDDAALPVGASALARIAERALQETP